MKKVDTIFFSVRFHTCHVGNYDLGVSLVIKNGGPVLQSGVFSFTNTNYGRDDLTREGHYHQKEQ